MATIDKADLSVAVLRDFEVSWLIALHKAIYNGDFTDNPANAEALEAAARTFAAQLPDQVFQSPDTILANLAKLNIQISVTAGDTKAQIKSTDDLLRISERPPMPAYPITICTTIAGFGEYCHRVPQAIESGMNPVKGGQ